MFFLDESCRAIRFQERIEGKVLTNYVFKSYQGINEEMCEINCFLEPGCVSYNHGTMGDGLFLCELSAREHMEVPSSELVTKDGFIYRAISIVSGKSCSYYSSMRNLLPWNYFCLSFLVSCLEKKIESVDIDTACNLFFVSFLFFSFAEFLCQQSLLKQLNLSNRIWQARISLFVLSRLRWRQLWIG